MRFRSPLMRWIGFVSAVATMFLAMTMFASDASAVSQFSRKYDLPCSMCHTKFPRLNYFGERFMMNGFQIPEEDPDGDTAAKTEINDDLFMDRVGNWFGARLNVDFVRYKPQELVLAGEKEGQLGFGSPNWLQFFVAGSIYKNVSIFIENEFKHDSFHFSWYHVGFHNIGGSEAVNFQVGNLSPVDFASYSNRLRINAPVKGDVFNVTATGGAASTANGGFGTAADGLSVSGSRPGIQYYGHGGQFVWWAGASPGKDASDVNDDQHFWAGLKWEIPAEGTSFEGTNFTIWSYSATDGLANPSVMDTENDYTRMSYQGNLRWNDIDVQAAFVDGTDDNWDLNPNVDNEVEYSGFSIVGGWNLEKWYPTVAYDKVELDSAPTALEAAARSKIETEMLTLALAYHPRQNFRIGLYARVDMDDDDAPNKNDIFVNMRTMF